MTALKPIENRRVRGVAASQYPSNLICAHPECDKQVDLRPNGDPTVHHIFPRSLTKSDSYFVEIETDEDVFNEYLPDGSPVFAKTIVIPHAVGLCGSGTTGHHGDVEEHLAWIKLEDGVYIWYDRVQEEWSCSSEEFADGARPPADDKGEWQKMNSLLACREVWERVGPLNPQPGSRDGKAKRKRTVKGTEERTARKTISVRLPEGVSGDDWDDLVEQAEEVELSQPDTQFDPAKGKITVGKLLVAVLERFTGRTG